MSSLELLYKTAPGRIILRALTSPLLSKAAGAFLSTGVSRGMIGRFIRKNAIDMGDYARREYLSFNDFFTRELKPGARRADRAPEALIAPCDSRVSVYSLGPDSKMNVKGISYTVAQLLGFDGDGKATGEDDPLAQMEELAQGLEGGVALVFRLCVDDYHRYCYFDSGSKGENVYIPGVLHTVRPIALESQPVFARNSREYCVLDTCNFGRCVQIEVGAMMVGKIRNLHGPCSFERGQEKGMFEFGGSTVVLLIGPGQVRLREDLEGARNENREIRVLLGEKIGEKAAEV